MTQLQVYRGSETAGQVHGEGLDLATIRQRVARIKRTWTPETVRARAIEGARRRSELAALLTGESGKPSIGDHWELSDAEDNYSACL